MGKIITYKNQGGGVFSQIQFDSGERVLVSISTPKMTVKIFKLLWGKIPTSTIFTMSLDQATNIFLKKEAWGKQGIILDKIVGTIKDSESISNMKDKLNQLVASKQTI